MTTRTPQVFRNTRIVSTARSMPRRLLARVLSREGNSLTIQQETSEAVEAHQRAEARAIGSRARRRAKRRGSLILLLASLVVELVWIAAIGYLIVRAI